MKNEETLHLYFLDFLAGQGLDSSSGTSTCRTELPTSFSPGLSKKTKAKERKSKQESPQNLGKHKLFFQCSQKYYSAFSLKRRFHTRNLARQQAARASHFPRMANKQTDMGRLSQTRTLTKKKLSIDPYQMLRGLLLLNKPSFLGPPKAHCAIRSTSITPFYSI